MAGLTSTGFTLKRLDEILAELNAGMKAIFGDNLNLDPESPDGQVNALMAESFADIWEQLQHVYNSHNPGLATGFSLSELVQFNAITRKQAIPSTVTLSFTGSNGTNIPAGSLFSTNDGAEFSTDALVTIAGGVATVEATATETGPISAVAGTVVNIDTPVTGLTTVNNVADAVLGQNVETDAELRSRRIRSIDASALFTLDAIRAAVLEVVDVVDAKVFQNTSNVTDANGIEPHSILVVVDDGTDADIAQAIFEKIPAGTGMTGSTTVVVTDSQGTNHNIKFSRPTVVPIHVIVTLRPSVTYDGDLAVKNAIVDFANGELVEGQMIGISDDVVYSSLYTPLNQSALGISSVISMLIGKTDPPAGTSDIEIALDEHASFIIANIDIVQVP